MKQAIMLNLTPGITETEHYKAWKFPGGEIHFKLKENFMEYLNDTIDMECSIITRINNSDDLIFLCIVVDTIAKTWTNKIHVKMPYMPYAQADRDFGEGECFSLRTITNILNRLPITTYSIYDAHSDVSPALLRNCNVEDNSTFITETLKLIATQEAIGTDGYFVDQQLVILSPDAGAYKKIFKLCEKIGFKGEIETANKYRNISSGDIEGIRLSKEDLGGKDILIIDDICIGGRTFIALAEQLRKRNVGNLFLAVSHGIFSNGLLELAKHFTSIFTTNSRAESYEDKISLVQHCQTSTGTYCGERIKFLYEGLFQLHAFEVI